LRRQTPSIDVKEDLLQGTMQTKPTDKNARYGKGCLIKRQRTQKATNGRTRLAWTSWAIATLGCRSSVVDLSANDTWGVGRGYGNYGDCHPAFRRAS
jgi:hypothetical protein